MTQFNLLNWEKDEPEINIPGLSYIPDFISAGEHDFLLSQIDRQMIMDFWGIAPMARFDNSSIAFSSPFVTLPVERPAAALHSRATGFSSGSDFS